MSIVRSVLYDELEGAQQNSEEEKNFDQVHRKILNSKKEQDFYLFVPFVIE